MFDYFSYSEVKLILEITLIVIGTFLRELGGKYPIIRFKLSRSAMIIFKLAVVNDSTLQLNKCIINTCVVVQRVRKWQ